MPSGDGSEKAVMDHVKASLVDHLARVREARSWSSYGPILTNSPTPGLYLEDGDIVGLPLSPHDAWRIKRQASQSSASELGDGMGCELKADQFEMRNPAWHKFIQSVGFNATKPFDIGTVHLTLRKLVLCDRSSGSAVREEEYAQADVWERRLDRNCGHRPSGEEIIGSMAFVLPSYHEGGDTKLTFGNETRTFPTAPTSDFNESFIAWFSDVQVTVEPIHSGYRLQLVYDLSQSQKTEHDFPGRPSANYLAQQINEFRSLLGQWTTFSERNDGPVPLVYIIDDELGDYKHQPLSCAPLKDADKHKVLFLQRQCLEKDVNVYLAKLTTSIDDDVAVDDEEPNTTMELHEITDLDGHLFVKQEVTIGKENLVSEDWFEDKDSNDSDFNTPEASDPWEELHPRLNENTRYFKNWALVLLPESQRLEFLAKNTSPEDLQSWIIHLSNILQRPDSTTSHTNTKTAENVVPQPQEELERELDLICTRALDRMQSWRKHDIGITSYLYHHENPNFAEALGAVVRATMILGNTNLVREAMIERPTKLSPALWQEVGACLDRSTLDKYGYGLNLALRQIPTIHEKILVLESVAAGYRHTSSEMSTEETLLDQWMQDRLEEALDVLEIVEEEDGRALVSVGKKLGRDFLVDQVTPFAKRHATNLPFAAEFVTAVCEDTAIEALDSDSVRFVLQEVFAVMIPAFTIENGKTPAKRRKIAQTPTTSVGHEDMDRWSLTGSRIAHLIGCCLTSDLEDEEKYLLNRIASEASNADDRTLIIIFIPFLQILRHVMEQNSVPFTTQDYRNLFQYIIALFIIEHVKMEPSRPANQTCPRAGCGAGRQCGDCWELDEFLRSPSQQCMDMTRTGQRRDHVERRVLASQSPYFRCDTIKNRHAPHTLRITKTLNEAWEASHSAWLRRCAQAKDMLAAIGHDALRQLLGNEYDECIELRSVRLGPVGVEPERAEGYTTQMVDLSEH